MKQKITAITAQQKNKNRYNIFLDGTYAFSVSEDTLIKYRLLKGRELDKTDLEAIFKADDLAKALDFALNYLSYSLKTVAETKKKLASLDLDDDQIEQVLQKLAQMHLLDDLAYAKSYTRTIAKTSTNGPLKIALALKKKGVSANDIEDGLMEYTPEMQRVNATKAAKKVLKAGQKLSFNKTMQKITQILMQKGFSTDIIAQVKKQLDYQKDEEDELSALQTQAEKLWHKNQRLDPVKRKLKVKTALFRQGFSLTDCDHILNELIQKDEVD